MSKFFYFFSVVFMIVHGPSTVGYCYAQEIPTGAWRTHNSYNAIHAVALSASKVYAASSNGIVVVHADNSLSTLTKMDGLSGTDITSMAFDQPRNQLLISYADGMLDIVRASEIISFSSLKSSSTIPGSKKINHVYVSGGLAFLSADYGMVVFDLNQLQVKETWRDLGPAGQLLAIRQSTILGDSIFLATQNGVLAGLLTDNLLDFANWKRFNQGAFNSSVKSIAAFNGKVYVAIDGAGLFARENGIWTLAYFPGSGFGALTTTNNLFITEGNNLWSLNPSGTLTQIQHEKIHKPVYALQDGSGKFWIGDLRNGLVSDKAGSFQSYIPNGPTFSGAFRLALSPSNQVFATAGGYTVNFLPADKNEEVNVFASGMWSTAVSLITTDVTDVDFKPGKIFASSFGGGLQVIDNGSSTIYNNGNSPLSTNRITAIASSPDGLWVTNYGSASSLHLLKNDNTWQSFSFPLVAAQFPTELLIDRIGQVWMVLNPAQGGGILVYNRERAQHVYLNEVAGSGALPSRSVFSIANDREGQVWVGTNGGVAYFPNPAQVFSGTVNSAKPVFEGRFLLRDETVTAIAVDGGNRKWMGTQRGLWLFDPFGEKQILNFNTANSPLLSDRIVDIEIQPITGEVFFATDKGIASYRSDATVSKPTFDLVKIFPNPVTAEFTGQVSISGLATDARVKITDIAGKLIWETLANGGTATWHVRDYNGKRAATGMYLVIAISQDGSNSVIGKIAVVN